MPPRHSYTREESLAPGGCVMRMGNHLGTRPVRFHTMAATNHAVGIAHVTVVPTNAAASPGDEAEGRDDEAE